MKGVAGITALVAASLVTACGGAAPPGGPGATSSHSLTTAATSSVPLPTPTATPAPAAPTAPLQCLPQLGGTVGTAHITDMLAEQAAGVDRLAIHFDQAVPVFEITLNSKGTSFVGIFSGLPITVDGSVGLHLQFIGTSSPSSYSRGSDLRLGYPMLREARVFGDFEGQTDIAIGLSSGVCPEVHVIESPPTLVLDFPT